MSRTILVFLMMFSATQLHAYSLNGSSWGHLPKPRVVSFAICDDGFGKAEKDRITAALNEWSVQNRLLLRVDNSKQCNTNTQIGECLSLNVIDRGPLDGLTPDFASAGGVTFRCVDEMDNSKTLTCSIRISDSAPIYSGPGAVPEDKYDLTSIILHEIGHCIGLGHTVDPDAVMFDGILPGKARRALASDDRNGRDHLYE